MDGVELEFEGEALDAIAKLAIARSTGARGLRAIVEAAMMDIMYDIPGRTDVLKCVITKETIKNSKPMLVVGETQKKQDANKPKKKESAS